MLGAGRVLCDDVLRRRMRTCVLSVSSTVGWSVGLSIPARAESKIARQYYACNMIIITPVVANSVEKALVCNCSQQCRKSFSL